MGAALLTGQKFRALCAVPVENACPLPVGRQEGPPAGARFPAWAVGTPLVSCADSSLGAGALPGRIWNPPLRPLRQPDGCHLSRRGEASCYRRRGPGLCLPALPCFRRTSRRRGPGKPPRLCHSVSPAILGTFGAQKYRIGAGHADVLPYHSCRRHTARSLPPSRYACYLPHQREALCTGRRPILQFPQGSHFTHQYQGP